MIEMSEIGKSGDGGFIDRSKVRILLCDNDGKSSGEVFTLLCKCSYQVTCVRSPRQVIDALNAEGPDIDIILSEVDLSMSKGLKMLKYIMRDKELRRIPIIMMSAQDEVSVVVKCLKFGAADYLVKPLRTNELLNLWTHMWRRRRMLGLAEKNIINYEIDLVVSDPSDVNTNSTTLFSDDTDDKPRKISNPETYVSNHQVEETAAAPVENAMRPPSECLADVSGISERTDADMSGISERTDADMSGISERTAAQVSPFSKKSELKIGESSAFFTYVKSITPRSNNQGSSSGQEKAPQHVNPVENPPLMNGQVSTNIQGQHSRDSMEKHSQADDYRSSNIIPDSLSVERSSPPSASLDTSQQKNPKVEFSHAQIHLRTDCPNNITGYHDHTAYPYYMSGVMNQVSMQPAPVYHKNLPDMQNHANSAVSSQYSHIPHCSPNVLGVASYPYYPFGMCIQPGQMPVPLPWPPFGNSSANERKLNKIDRREAALMKFRQKRKERCFDKKIRYVNRKKLAERRPRLRGQFIRKVNGVHVDLNGQPAEDDEEEEEYDEEDQSANMDFPLEDDTSINF